MFKELKAEDCKNIDEIRDQIDRLDTAIMELFAERKKFVTRIVDFKQSEEAIVAKDRQAMVYTKIRKLAEQFNLETDVYESIYKTLINYNIQEEMKLFKAHSKK